MAGLRKVEFVQSNRGKQQVLLDGYTYSQNRVNEEATYWRCTKRPCKGKITTVVGFLRNSFGHDHPPSNETTVKFHEKESTIRNNTNATDFQRRVNEGSRPRHPWHPHVSQYQEFQPWCLFSHRHSKTSICRAHGRKHMMASDVCYSVMAMQIRWLSSLLKINWGFSKKRTRSTWMERSPAVHNSGTNSTVCMPVKMTRPTH